MTKLKKIEILKAQKEEASNLHTTMIDYYENNKEMLSSLGMQEDFLVDCASSNQIADKLQVEIEYLTGERK